MIFFPSYPDNDKDHPDQLKIYEKDLFNFVFYYNSNI